MDPETLMGDVERTTEELIEAAQTDREARRTLEGWAGFLHNQGLDIMMALRSLPHLRDDG